MYRRLSIRITWRLYYSLHGRFIKKLLEAVTMEKLSGAAARTGSIKEGRE